MLMVQKRLKEPGFSDKALTAVLEKTKSSAKQFDGFISSVTKRLEEIKIMLK